MKLPLLLAQFLYKNKKLSLPGIGIFTLDPSAELPDAHSKNNQLGALGIEFKNAVITTPDEELISFIQSNTGKIKPVAVADLDSYLKLGEEMLNIGKPFFLEGIGTISRQKGGGFDFIPGDYIAGEPTGVEKHERASKRKPILEEAHHFEPQPNSNRKIILFVAIVIGLCIIGWGGYMLYKKNGNEEKKPEVSEIPVDTVAAAADSSRFLAARDSVAEKNQELVAANISSKDSSAYKYVILQTYNKERALRRFNQLKSYELKINMYTKDSSFFKLYFSFPAAAKDTVHIKDSLSREYAHSVTIER